MCLALIIMTFAVEWALKTKSPSTHRFLIDSKTSSGRGRLFPRLYPSVCLLADWQFLRLVRSGSLCGLCVNGCFYVNLCCCCWCYVLLSICLFCLLVWGWLGLLLLFFCLFLFFGGGDCFFVVRLLWGEGLLFFFFGGGVK